ncbi:MAG: DNA translocase FtsK [Chlorobiota bacterium]|nr:MAG: DNA translocase FtsK [Chlorobiota bacterium]
MPASLDDTTIERAVATRKRRRRSSSEEPSSRNAAIIGILLALVAILLGIALLSYSPADQSNTEVSLSELLRLLRNDDAVRAKLETTHNWLGLLGAIIADFLLHDTFGYAAVLLLALPMWWARDLFRMGTVDDATWRKSALLLLCVCAWSLWFGALRLVWNGLAIEWSGLVGEFLATISATIAGTMGAIVLSSAMLFFACVFVTGTSLVALVNRLRAAGVHAASALAVTVNRIFASKTTAPKPQKINVQDSDSSRELFAFLRRTAQAEPRIVTPTEEDLPTPTGRTTKQQQPGDPAPAGSAARKLTLTVQPSPQSNLPAQQSPTQDQSPQAADRIRTNSDETILFTPPPLDLLLSGKEEQHIDEEELKTNARLLQEKLETFKIKIENVTVIPGPVITQYEFVPAAGVKISQIEALADDIALALKAKGIRIIAPIPGKGTVGVEIPNHTPSLVRFRSIVASRTFRDYRGVLPLGLGKTITGDVYCCDLAELPHLLIAGATGSGKSVGINTIIMSLLYRLHPRHLKLVIIDPKKVELTFYTKLKHHYLAASPDIDEVVVTSPTNAVVILKALVAEMEQRYDLLAKVGQRKISDYNRKLAEGTLKNSSDQPLEPMPYIVVIIDELADLMMTARNEVEDSIIRLAQLARAVGIHLVVATQRPSVDVITGLIKANFPARIAYQVASKVDSRTILDTVGAEQLLGNGDLLFTPGGQRPIRLQNSFITTEEVEAITDFIGKQRGYSTPYMLPSVAQGTGRRSETDADFDPLFVEAARIVVHAQQGSTSLLQRRLRIGYSRAARIVDQLEAAGILGPFDGSKARQVLIESDAELDMRLGELGLI